VKTGPPTRSSGSQWIITADRLEINMPLSTIVERR